MLAKWQNWHTLVGFMAKWKVLVFRPKMLLKNLKSNIRTLLGRRLKFHQEIATENALFPIYSVFNNLKNVLQVVC